ncbi:hypothetical protein H2201_003427 [Coniosporium apollinis]|uniref:Tr-type G domain-containing protein n=1 Tax=Coniosporium apollinis TaxID=61459 RepID=A0ABQ9NVT5_9PEZI|nr:hypothetical protein H2201_003427 [Coniosporium apollinis]
MESIFSWSEASPRVSSPWSTPRAVTPRQAPAALEPEPQEGPVEYKLHLLLRPRRTFSKVSRSTHISGSYRQKLGPPARALRSDSEPLLSSTPPLAASNLPRQDRFEHLTTQLLWRLRESSPIHQAGSTKLIIPQLPELTEQLSAPTVVNELFPGLEESKGALYEIGVSDDGTLVGLAGDEMEESLNNLRVMAASLGCTVDLLRMESIGDCEWLDPLDDASPEDRQPRKDKLWVAEAYIKPHGHWNPPAPLTAAQKLDAAVCALDGGESRQLTQQLRVSLTGQTGSGKSSLLGSLSTATLDNGKGKSRLSLLKHMHEQVSGMTSSVTQELIGYRSLTSSDSRMEEVEVINYASHNVSSWEGIHTSAQSGRLVFLSDSAGHLRYRRTTVRGLIGWAPHWTLLCVPADGVEHGPGQGSDNSSSPVSIGSVNADRDLSGAHLNLCLNLNLPLVIVITKLDLASKVGLRRTLSSLLSALKSAGKKPVILSDTSSAVSEADLGVISASDLRDARSFCGSLSDNLLGAVPIILTSAVKGTGISKLHAVLHELPIPPPPAAPLDELIEAEKPPDILFHIEDVYIKQHISTLSQDAGSHSCIISGHLRYGALNVGDELVLGPFYTESGDTGDIRRENHRHLRPTDLMTSASFPGALHKQSHLTLPHAGGPRNGQTDGDYRSVRIISIRNLRLPVRSLQVGQVGTVGLQPLGWSVDTPSIGRARKGMVLAGPASAVPKAKLEFVARFEGPAAQSMRAISIGSAVVCYTASVRAGAKVVGVAIDEDSDDREPHDRGDTQAQKTPADPDADDSFGFGFEDDASDASGSTASEVDSGDEDILVTFRFIASKEFVETGAQVLVMPGGGPGLYGGNSARGVKGVAALDGFVGKIVARTEGLRC